VESASPISEVESASPISEVISASPVPEAPTPARAGTVPDAFVYAGRVPGTETPTRERRTSDAGTGLGPPWRVIVLNDNHNTFEGVAAALAATLPGVTYEVGMRYANRIHASGRATVWTGHREAAELYWEQLAGFGLTMAPLEQG
jgi:ATP-dependent Clp protease adaptor protein ClpS